jgi:ribosomal protein S18 acetylase RimI-like enzyme
MSANGIRIRKARATAPELAQLARLFDAYRQFYGKPPALSLARKFLADRLRRRESVIYVAERIADKHLVGFVQLYPIFSSVQARRSWVLNDLYVEADARRTGAGKQLVEQARLHGLSTKAAFIELATAHDNMPAQSLYESLGYVRDRDFVHYSLTLPATSTG